VLDVGLRSATAHTRAGACTPVGSSAPRASDSTPTRELAVPPQGVVIHARGGRATVELRRFASDWSPPDPDVVPDGGSAVLRIPRDGDPRPWRVRVSAQERVSVCGLR
jgi:hypothetical protein